jgi:hypothetical protein
MKRWRIIENEWNLKRAPWSGAIGIEEVDDELAVPPIVCWFTRGWAGDGYVSNDHPAVLTVKLHNQAIDAKSHSDA